MVIDLDLLILHGVLPRVEHVSMIRVACKSSVHHRLYIISKTCFSMVVGLFIGTAVTNNEYDDGVNNRQVFIYKGAWQSYCSGHVPVTKSTD